jgi:hypothetical protein
MTYISRFIKVGDKVQREYGQPLVQDWTVVKIAKHGRQATVRDRNGEARQIFRGKFDTWRFMGDLVVFHREDTPAEPASADGPTFEPVLLAEPADTTPAGPADALSALDLVKPLADEGVRLYREYLDQAEAARQRRVDPNKSQLVAQAQARFDGACEVLARMWQLLGMDPKDMDCDAARRGVVRLYDQQIQAQATPPLPSAEQLAAAVREHAEANYDREGWDFVVEAYTD